MKKLLSVLAILCATPFVMGQTPTENYVSTTAYQVETQNGSTNANTSVSLSADEKIEAITYFDGLGRPKQSVAKQAGGNRQDIITPLVYDPFGRQPLDYLPYADVNETSGGSLNYRDPLALLSNLESYYVGKHSEDQITSTTINAYSEKHFEPSPLNRVLEQAAPGNDWAMGNGHTIKFEYLTNSETDYVKLYEVSFLNGDTESPQLVDAGVYLPSELYKTLTKDENWQPNQSYPNDHTTEEYKDKQGRVVLKRTHDKRLWHDTYYVYDDFGNLTYVLPPKMSTYKYILQQKWESLEFTDDQGLFVNEPDDNEIQLIFSNSGLSYLIINAGGAALELKQGLVMDLGSRNSMLPDMNLGDLYFGSGGIAGSAYLQNGDLYFNSSGSTGNGVSCDISFDLSSYQDVFAPPPIDQAQLDNLGYQYRYDGRNRLIEKKIPGKEWEYIVYNKLDQPVLTQDTNLKSQNKWLFTKYDASGRIAYTGLMNSPDTRANLQVSLNGQAMMYESQTSVPSSIDGTSIYYNNMAYPTANIDDLLTIYYYDSYIDLPQGLNSTITTYYGLTSSVNTKSLPTASRVRVLGSDLWNRTVSYYDGKARPIYTYSVNPFLGTTDIVESRLDFTGKVIEAKNTHKKEYQTDIVILNTYDYDHAGRLISQKQNINGQGEELIANNHYDELGQLVKKDVGNSETSPLQKVDYAYNIRGWLKNINDPSNLYQDNDLFSFGINYNKPDGPSTLSTYNKPLYNGNISHVYWKTNNESSSLKHYSYDYDALNRFTRAYFAENSSYNYKFNTYIYGYDRNGNIEYLYRTMPDPNNPNSYSSMDYLKYSYDSGNILLAVKELYGSTANGAEGFKDGNTTGDDYNYDANGNMTQDLNKGVTDISYNHLNLPKQVNINDGGSNVGTISYIYDATGVKLKKIVSNGATTTYAGNYIYENNVLKFFSQPEGYVEPNGSGGYDYIYQYKDHLGNIRLSYMDAIGNYQNILDSDFETDFDGWVESGSVNYSLDNGRIKANVNAAWEGIRHYLTGIVTVAGETLKIKLDFDKGNTQSNVRLYLPEYDTNNVLVRYNELHSNLQTGYGEHTLTMQDSGNTIGSIHIDKDNTNTGTETYFYVGHVSLTRGELEIVEENNYYPFGLQHKGYNNVVNGTEHPYKFGGKELSEELGLNTYDFGARNYQPDLGRWFNVDNKADATGQIHNSPYSYGLNNPIAFTDPDGDCPPGVNCENVLANMERVRVNRASNLGAGNTRNNGTKFHAGHDLYASAGTGVRSSMAGTVERAGTSNSYGNYVTVKTTHTEHIPTGNFTTRADGTILPVTEEKTSTYYAFYAHLESSSVETGDAVTAGQEIGTVGTTGNADGLTGDNVHLHFEIGTELRSANSPFLKKSSLLDANTGYKDVTFTSQNPNAQNQSNKGVWKTTTDANGNQSYIYQNFNNTTTNGTDQEWRIPMALPPVNN